MFRRSLTERTVGPMCELFSALNLQRSISDLTTFKGWRDPAISQKHHRDIDINDRRSGREFTLPDLRSFRTAEASAAAIAMPVERFSVRIDTDRSSKLAIREYRVPDTRLITAPSR